MSKHIRNHSRSNNKRRKSPRFGTVYNPSLESLEDWFNYIIDALKEEIAERVEEQSRRNEYTSSFYSMEEVYSDNFIIR